MVLIIDIKTRIGNYQSSNEVCDTTFENVQ